MYKCVDFGHKYAQMTADGCCEKPECFGAPLIPDGKGPEEEPVSEEPIEGLCILVCDISQSMDLPAFAGSPAEKLKLVVGAIQRAIAGLQNMTKADNAYIAIIAFGSRAKLIQDEDGKPFFKSVSSIIQRYGKDAARLHEYLYPYFKEDRAKVGRGETDITEALLEARRLCDHMMRADLSPIGVTAPANLIEHSDIFDGVQSVDVPNMRVMIYSDGAHGAHKNHTVVNAFSDLEPSPLMTALIGDPSDSDALARGSIEMMNIANTCPIHKVKGFFPIDKPERYAVLRNLFRMASGASGFCEECLKVEMRSFEDVR